MIRITAATLGLIALLAMPQIAQAEVPGWLRGTWATSARLTAPDGAQLRIRCTLEASAPTSEEWQGRIRCATVQGRFQGEWAVTLQGAEASGEIAFFGLDESRAELSGTLRDDALRLRTPDGEGAGFAPGGDGALLVDMERLGPQNLSGTLSFEPR